MASLRFLPKDDARLLGTLDAIARELDRDGWIQRYRHDDGFGPPDVAFVLCTLWHVEALAGVGRAAEAESVLARALGSRRSVSWPKTSIPARVGSGATSRRPIRTSA